MTRPLFPPDPTPARLALGPQACVLGGFALPHLADVMPALRAVLAAAPLRHLVTPGGFTMSVAMSNCGALGWTSDRRGYRYTRDDPDSGRPCPAMPAAVRRLATAAAAEAGFDGFAPDACLINHYVPDARLSLHQDRDERDFDAPIVSVSLGLPATVLFRGLARADKAARVPLVHGDVVVWGGGDRLRHHGVLPLRDGEHPLLGAQRINFTFRKAG